MRLERLTPTHLRRAIEIYLQQAWPPDRPERPSYDLHRLDAPTTTEGMLALFDRAAGALGPTCEHYTLRLGNWRYPFMKLALQEYLVRGEYFFSCVQFCFTGTKR